MPKMFKNESLSTPPVLIFFILLGVLLSWLLLSQFMQELGRTLGFKDLGNLGERALLLLITIVFLAFTHLTGLAKVTAFSSARNKYFLGIIFTVSAAANWYFFECFDGYFGTPREQAMTPFRTAISSGGTSLAKVILSICIMAPVIEELVYRLLLVDLIMKLAAYIFNRKPLSADSSFAISILISGVLSSLIFAFMHPQYTNVSTFMWVFFVGLLCFVARIVSGGIALPILVHAIGNSLTVAKIYWTMN